MHLGRDRVICAYEVDGLIVDPGPASCVETLLDRLGPANPRALLLTHIHLDHAGATGRALPPLPRPAGLRARESGRRIWSTPPSCSRAPGASTATTCGSSGARWRRCPEDRIHPLRGGETVEGFRVAYTPGHASHHVELPERGERRRLRRRRGRRPHPALRAHGGAHAAAGHRRGGLARLAPHDRLVEPALALPDALRPGDRRGRAPAPRALGAARGGRLRPPRRRGALHRARSSRGSAQNTDPATVEAFEQAIPPDQAYRASPRYWRKRAG